MSCTRGDSQGEEYTGTNSGAVLLISAYKCRVNVIDI